MFEIQGMSYQCSDKRLKNVKGMFTSIRLFIDRVIIQSADTTALFLFYKQADLYYYQESLRSWVYS